MGVPAFALAAASLAALAACGGGKDVRAALQVIPAPASVEIRQGRFRIADGTRIHASGTESLEIARYFVGLVARTRGIALELSESSDESGVIRLLLAPANVVSPESYELSVAADGIEIRAGDARGLFYGAVTLWQLMTADAADSGPAVIPAAHIIDAPRFAWRGLMLDSARHYQPPVFIKKLIDSMALHKLNVLHWHLTDDQGWRLEIRKYPLLTEVGAWRVPAGAAWPREPDPATGRPPVYGGFYTPG